MYTTGRRKDAQSNKNAHVLVGGDFNCGNIEWSTMQVPEGVPKRPVQT